MDGEKRVCVVQKSCRKRLEGKKCWERALDMHGVCECIEGFSEVIQFDQSNNSNPSIESTGSNLPVGISRKSKNRMVQLVQMKNQKNQLRASNQLVSQLVELVRINKLK